MSVAFWNIEWTDQNSQRSYPLTTWSSKTDKTGTFMLPHDLILGLYFPVASNIEILPDRFFIKRIAIYGTGLSISVGYDDDSVAPPLVATAQIALHTHSEYDVYGLPGKNEFADSIGRIMLGKLDVLRQVPVGSYEFEPQATALEADAIQPMIRGVTSLVVNGVHFQDDVILEAGENIEFTLDADNEGNPVVRIDAVDSSQLNLPAVCGDRTNAPPIRMLNGVAPTSDGNFELTGNQCLNVVALQHGLRLEDVCAEPCCDCRDLKELVSELELTGRARATVEAFVSRLEARIDTMAHTMMGSLIGDTGCQPCVLTV